MSCNNEEKGEFTLPGSAVIPLRRALVEAENAYRAQVHEAAAALHSRITEVDANGKRTRLSELNKILRGGGHNAQWKARGFLGEALNKLDGSLGSHPMSYSRSNPRWSMEVRDEAMALVLPYPKPGAPLKFQAPKKKDLPPLPASTTHFSGSCWSLFVDPKTRVVSWEVSRGNRNSEEAWEAAVPKAFDKALRAIKWTRATGGHIRYRDEYSEDSEMDWGGSAVSLQRCMGPLGDRAQASHSGLPVSFYKESRKNRKASFVR